MESNARLLLSAAVVDKTDKSTIIAIKPGFDDEPWNMELAHRLSENMGPERSAAYVTERYLLDHPFQLATVGREAISAAVLQVIR